MAQQVAEMVILASEEQLPAKEGKLYKHFLKNVYVNSIFRI